MYEGLGIVLAVIVGAMLVIVVGLLRRRRESALARSLLEQSEKQSEAALHEVVEQLKTAYAALSRDALSQNSDDFLKLAVTRLESQTIQGEKTLEVKKKLIDARLVETTAKLAELNTHIRALEKHRAEAYGSLRSEIRKTAQATELLHETTAKLKEALANPQRRGQWGERMAEDVLRLTGLIEGINYEKQKQLANGSRPDFTFFLPDDRCVHMDVKFPLENYLRMLDATDDTSRKPLADTFLKDVRARIREVTTRGYIDPSAGTLDYVILFIPNEQVYSFIHEHDACLLDESLRSKVVLASPLSLYAILAVIRQASENFRLEQGAKQILDLLAAIQKQWGKYVDSMDGLGKKIEQMHREYQDLVGTRTRQLDRQFQRIEDLREARHQPALRD